MLPMFHGRGRDDAKQHWFTREAIWYVKHIIDEASTIKKLETTSIDGDMTWYMKYKVTMLARHGMLFI
jgi:hypothetical protein